MEVTLQCTLKQIIVYNGITYIQTTTGFKPIPTNDTLIKNKNYDPIPSFISFGSPMNGEVMKGVIEKIGYKYAGAYTKEGDFVGEAIGGNKGNNEQASILDGAKLHNLFKLLLPNSPHSTYKCEDYQTERCRYKK